LGIWNYSLIGYDDSYYYYCNDPIVLALFGESYYVLKLNEDVNLLDLLGLSSASPNLAVNRDPAVPDMFDLLEEE